MYSRKLPWILASVAVLFLGFANVSCDSDRVPPYLNKFQVQKSPDGQFEATFYNYGGGESGFLGATVSTPLYVNVLPTKTPFDPKQNQVFAMRHAYDVKLIWKTNRRLLVRYPNNAAVDKKIDKAGEIEVVYKNVYDL